MKKRTARLIAGTLLLFLSPQLSEAEIFRRRDYELRLEAHQAGDELVLSGRIEGGTFCQALRIETRLSDERGEGKRIVMRVGEVGGIYSRLLEKRLKVKRPERSWLIEQVELQCEDR